MKSLTNSRFSWPALLTESTTGIAFGGDYNPDQWPEDVWTQDIELMKRAGVNVVALGIFSWDRIQPTEDTWDFAWLDRIIGLLGEAGIAVDLATSTASAPMWLYKRYPQVLPVDKYGHTVHAGSRQSWRPTSKVFREFALEMCRQLALRYGNNLTVTSWHVGNEYGWNNRLVREQVWHYRCAQRSMGHQLLVARSAQLRRGSVALPYGRRLDG